MQRTPSSLQDKDFVVVGRITTVYGVKGWVKVHSYTEPCENAVSYQPWHLFINKQWITVKIDVSRKHGTGLVAHIVGCDDRDKARLYTGVDILVARELIPEPKEGEYYWRQLEGLKVVTDKGVTLGKIDHLIETGANDVLVVKGDESSVDQRERLIPYLPDRVVKHIDLKAGMMTVDWDPEF